MFLSFLAYIKNIALLMLLTIIIELVMPDMKIKKYMSVVMGVIMIFTIVGDITNIFSSFDNYEISIPAFNYDYDVGSSNNIKERLSKIIYNELIEETKEEVSFDFNIHIDRIENYNKNTDEEVVS